ncbi:SCF E3 ubiquitin ligase complex F-box protein grrA [Ceratobasidium sp. AG-Ba]|nr:SCF E3 ubiquitin ligase complex F-box protein grrA [Ceratobasidium sp. AG-Ba]QRW11776.1 SCF E3 ubiquitin ligase complex F-box protein grrA [Ceratobasidium sp. AG-Ba]
MSFPSSPSTHTHDIMADHSAHEARSEVESIPIGLAVDFADEMEFGIGMGLGGDGQGQEQIDHSASVPSPSPSMSQTTDLDALSPTHTATTLMTTPPTSPGPVAGPSWKGKGRAIPTPAGRLLSPPLSAMAFQTPPDTTFGTPGASGSGSRTRGRPKMREETPAVGEDLPSIMPLSPSPSPSPTPRPSRVRAISGLSFTSLRETIAHRRSRSGTASPSIEGVPKRKLSLRGLGALVKRAGKTKSRPGSGLNSEVASTASSAFQTPSSSLPRRTAAPPRPSVADVWQEDKTEVPERPVRGRADTAPVVVGDYFGYKFDSDQGSDEPSREDSSDIIQAKKPPAPLNPFELLPRELHLLVLGHLVDSYIQDHNRAIQSNTWSVSQASSEQGKWHGEAAGLRAMVATARVSRAWYALAHDGTFWTRLNYASLVPPRIAVPAITGWLSSALRHEAKAPVTIDLLDGQDERVMRLIKAAGPCLGELDLRGFARFGAADVKRMLASITLPTRSTTRPGQDPAPGANPVRSLLTLTRFDALPPPPTRTTNLTRLVLTSCIKLSTQALNALLAASPLLDRLEMRGLSSVTDETITIITARCRLITWLDVGRCSNLGPHALPLINGTHSDGGLPRLKTLRMAGYSYLDPSVFRQLSPALETLDLAGVWSVTDECLAAYVEIEPSEAQVGLARLAELERWARSIKGSAEDLSIPAVPFVTLTAREAGLDPTLRGPYYRRRTALRHLNLSGCRRVSDSGLGALAHAVPDLEVLELAGIGSGLGPAGLVRLFNTTRKIRRVDLEDANITDSVLDALTPPMTEDTDDGSGDTDDEESIQIAMRTNPVHPGHALTHLIVSHCTQITSAALAQVVRACPRLKVLALDGTPADDRVVRFFVCATRARGLTGTEVVATDTRFVARAGLPTSGIRARRGGREWATRGLGYVDARDPNTTTLENEDECNETKVVLKTYWSWQGVDGLLERRRAMLANSGRRNTADGATGLFVGRGSGATRWGRHRHDERGGCVVM